MAASTHSCQRGARLLVLSPHCSCCEKPAAVSWTHPRSLWGRSMCGSVVPQASIERSVFTQVSAPGGSSGGRDTHPRPDCSWWWAVSLNLLPRPAGAVGSLHSRWDLWMDASVFLVTPSVTFQYTLCSFNWTKWLKNSCYTIVKFHLFWFKMMILIRPWKEDRGLKCSLCWGKTMRLFIVDIFFCLIFYFTDFPNFSISWAYNLKQGCIRLNFPDKQAW